MTIECKNFDPDLVPHALDGTMITYEVECFSCDGIYMEDGTPIPPPLRISGFEEHESFKDVEKLCREHDQSLGWRGNVRNVTPGGHDIQIRQFNFPRLRQVLFGSNN